MRGKKVKQLRRMAHDYHARMKDLGPTKWVAVARKTGGTTCMMTGPRLTVKRLKRNYPKGVRIRNESSSTGK